MGDDAGRRGSPEAIECGGDGAVAGGNDVNAGDPRPAADRLDKQRAGAFAIVDASRSVRRTRRCRSMSTARIPCSRCLRSPVTKSRFFSFGPRLRRRYRLPRVGVDGGGGQAEGERIVSAAFGLRMEPKFRSLEEISSSFRLRTPLSFGHGNRDRRRAGDAACPAPLSRSVLGLEDASGSARRNAIRARSTRRQCSFGRGTRLLLAPSTMEPRRRRRR